MMMKKYKIKLAAAGVIFSLAVCLNAWAQSGQSLQKPLAMVNEVAITQNDLDMETGLLEVEMSLRNYPLGDRQLADLRNQLIGNLVDRELLYQQATSRDIEISAHWVNREWDEMKTQLGGEAAVRTYLERTGWTWEQMESRIRKGLIVRRLLRREVFRGIRVSEAEMQAFYSRHPEFFNREEQVRARHLMIAVPDWDNESGRQQALNRIQALEQKIREGADLGALAIAHSDCPSRSRGGDLGYFIRSQMIQPFSEAAFALQPGQISQAVKTRFGYHLIEVIDRQPPSRMAYKNVRDKIELTLRRNKEKAAAETYLSRLKQKARISIN
jgi:parvulin-like peptidyl-prolyl isomerase